MDKKQARMIELLERKQISLGQLEEMLAAKLAVKPIIKRSRRTKRFKLAIIGDTHLVDKACALAELASFYALCKRLGYRVVVHAGDILTGMTVYKGQTNDLVAFGVDDHLKFLIENYPFEEGVKTYFIGGN